MRSGLSLLPRLILGVALLAPRAGANTCNSQGSGTPRERAKAYFQAGISAFDAKRYSEAVDHLSCANQLLPNPAFSYNIAVTYEAMGDTPTALRWYREHLRLAGAEAATDAVKAKVAALEAQLQARGVQQVSVLSEPAGAMLSIDDRPIGLTPMTLELNPGLHRYRLALAGHAAAEGSFELRADRALDVRAALAVEPAQPAANATAALSGIGTWTWISFGAGTVLLGGAIGFEIRRAQLDDELGRVAQADFQQRYDAMTAQQTAARVLAGIGGAALIGGGVLLVHDLGAQHESTDLTLGACSLRGLCVSASGAF